MNTEVINILIIIIFCLTTLFSFSVGDKPCIPRKYNYNSIVCVCNATYCDEISEFKSVDDGKFLLYSSSLAGDRLKKTDGMFENITSTSDDEYEDNNDDDGENSDEIIKIYRNETYQSIHGFGGSFSDSAGLNIVRLSIPAQQNLINSYFSRNGLQYNMARVSIGGSDFSARRYAYNMEPEDDVKLSNFSLTYEDFEYKIPLIKKAKAIATDELFLIASSWSSPLWMKTIRDYGGEGLVIPKYYQTWADYHLKFLKEYAKNNITYWAITTNNEPLNGVFLKGVITSLGWFPVEQASWIANNLGPTIKNSEFSDILILCLDDQRTSLPWWLDVMSENKNVMKYIDGISLHWYANDASETNLLDETHEQYPDLFMISTEACIPRDVIEDTEAVQLGNWIGAEKYMEDIIEDLNHWHTGWIDWNLALDRSGGPNCFDNRADAPVIVIPENDEFLKQPMFYVMGHFSKFIPRGSKRVLTKQIGGETEHVAFIRPDGFMTLVFYNKFDSDKNLTIVEDGKGQVTVDIPAHSIHTMIYG